MDRLPRPYQAPGSLRSGSRPILWDGATRLGQPAAPASPGQATLPCPGPGNRPDARVVLAKVGAGVVWVGGGVGVGGRVSVGPS